MRLFQTSRSSDARNDQHVFRSGSILLPAGTLLLICSAGSLFAQMNPGQFTKRNSLGPQTVSKNQLLAPPKAVRAIQRAQKDMGGGHLESAQKEIARALDIAPHFAAAKVLQGAIDIESEHYEAARTLFQEAINDDPTLGGSYVGMAVVMIHDGRFQAALPVLDRAEGLLPAAWLVHFVKAWAQLELGDTAAALKQADCAEQTAGTDSDKRSGVSYLRAMVSIHLQDMTAAREHLADAVRLDRGSQYAALANLQLQKLQPLLAARR